MFSQGWSVHRSYCRYTYHWMISKLYNVLFMNNLPFLTMYWIKFSTEDDYSECCALDAIKLMIFQIISFALLPVTSILTHTSYYVYFYDIQNYSNLFIILQRSTYPGNGCYFIYVNREINNNEMLLYLHHKINILFLI